MSEQVQTPVLEDYLQKQANFLDVKTQLQYRLKRMKQKIDYVIQKKQTNAQVKQIIKYILTQLQTLQKVYDKLWKENLQKYDQLKTIIMKQITLQIQRFNKIIPDQLQKSVNKSRLTNPVFISKINAPDTLQAEKTQRPMSQTDQTQATKILSKIVSFMRQKSRQQQVQIIYQQFNKGIHVNLQQQKSIQKQSTNVIVETKQKSNIIRNIGICLGIFVLIALVISIIIIKQGYDFMTNLLDL